MTVTPPTRANKYASVIDSATATKLVSVTGNAGDYLVVMGFTEGQGITLATPTGGSLTYTLKESKIVTNWAPIYIWWAQFASSTTFNVSIGRASGSAEWGYIAEVWSGCTGIGGSNSGTGSGLPSLGVTCTGADSGLAVVATDWNTTAGANTWSVVNGASPTEEADTIGNSRYYAAYYADTGTAGSKTIGMSAPSGQVWAIGGIELLGTTSGGGSTQHSAGFFAADA